MECETISAWLDEDQLDPNIIMLALKEAVLANKRSLRYIDKILLEWQRNGLTSVQAVQDHIVSFRKKQVAKLDKAEPGRSLEFPFYNWLER
jgi:DNA replication protein